MPCTVQYAAMTAHHFTPQTTQDVTQWHTARHTERQRIVHEMEGLLETRFEAWRAGDRRRLLEWWRADRQRGYNRARTRLVI